MGKVFIGVACVAWVLYSPGFEVGMLSVLAVVVVSVEVVPAPVPVAFAGFPMFFGSGARAGSGDPAALQGCAIVAVGAAVAAGVSVATMVDAFSVGAFPGGSLRLSC